MRTNTRAERDARRRAAYARQRAQRDAAAVRNAVREDARAAARRAAEALEAAADFERCFGGDTPHSLLEMMTGDGQAA